MSRKVTPEDVQWAKSLPPSKSHLPPDAAVSVRPTPVQRHTIAASPPNDELTAFLHRRVRCLASLSQSMTLEATQPEVSNHFQSSARTAHHSTHGLDSNVAACELPLHVLNSVDTRRAWKESKQQRERMQRSGREAHHHHKVSPSPSRDLLFDQSMLQAAKQGERTRANNDIGFGDGVSSVAFTSSNRGTPPPEGHTVPQRASFHGSMRSGKTSAARAGSPSTALPRPWSSPKIVRRQHQAATLASLSTLQPDAAYAAAASYGVLDRSGIVVWDGLQHSAATRTKAYRRRL